MYDLHEPPSRRRRSRRLREGQPPVAKPPQAAPAVVPAKPATVPAPAAIAKPSPVTVEPKENKRSLLSDTMLALFAGAIVYIIIDQNRRTSQLKGETELMPLVRDAARAANVPPSVLAGIVTSESSWSNAPIPPSKNPLANWRCCAQPDGAKVNPVRGAAGNWTCPSGSERVSCSQLCGVSCIASADCAIGVAQVLPSTAKMSAQALCEPANSLIAGARYLRSMYTRYYSRPGVTPERAWFLAALAYNQGPGNVDGWLKSGVVSDKGNVMPDGSRTVTEKGVAYANKVITSADKYRSQGLAGVATSYISPRTRTSRLTA